jgi:DNA invertase Pin-like site-specific DNA recombinase
MSPTVGHARVSSFGQDLEVQLEKLKQAGCAKIFREKRSGVDTGRPQLREALEYLREGDICDGALRRCHG